MRFLFSLMMLCGAGAAEAAPTVAEPVTVARAEVAEICASYGGEITRRKGFARRIDLDADGTMDLVIDYGRAECSQIAGMIYCGSVGCRKTLYRGLPSGGFQEVLRENFYEMRTRSGPILELEAHGSYCGRAGSEGCTLRFSWQDGALVPMQ